MNLRIRYKSKYILHDFDRQVIEFFSKFDFRIFTTTHNGEQRALIFTRPTPWPKAEIDYE
jgi:hypothetical protein